MEASLTMLIKICNKKGEFFTKTYDDANILQYTSEIWKGYKIYFDLSKCPIDDGFKNSNGWKDLQRLQVQRVGYDIVPNGCPTKKLPTNAEYVAIEVFCILTKTTSLLILIEVLH